jgi:hypothetical protein
MWYLFGGDIDMTMGRPKAELVLIKEERSPLHRCRQPSAKGRSSF